MKNNNDFIDLFEKKLCEFTGAPYAVVTDRCTNSIILSLELTQNKNKKIKLPNQCYVSVPMMLIKYGYKISFCEDNWVGKYQIGDTNIWDCAVGFFEKMYVPGEIQCLSFQQKKRLSIGKGGAILLDDPNLAKKMKRYSMDGRDSSINIKEEIERFQENIVLGYHFNMSPDEAAKGILLLNQLKDEYTLGSYSDYPKINTLECFKDYLK
jgi:dTDP-4-amino-4,6-dideoxygalactose transaminase